MSSAALELLQKRKDAPDAHRIWIFEGSVNREQIKNTWRSIRERTTITLWQEDPTLDGFISEVKEKHGKKFSFKKCLEDAEAQSIHLPMGVLDLRMHDLRFYLSIFWSRPAFNWGIARSHPATNNT
ncbi:hypothetical protein [Terasakiella sp. SH-1]|uniref:hypothetical protein n=1 Tax=Terasakiella sp. SH-1 TaxID=2560057 RepID=UPI00142F59D1|nr:hypothetical protein [Terasakiella sp. SH-1]